MSILNEARPTCVSPRVHYEDQITSSWVLGSVRVAGVVEIENLDRPSKLGLFCLDSQVRGSGLKRSRRIWQWLFSNLWGMQTGGESGVSVRGFQAKKSKVWPWQLMALLANDAQGHKVAYILREHTHSEKKTSSTLLHLPFGKCPASCVIQQNWQTVHTGRSLQT